MKAILAALLSLFLAGPVAALSCLPPDAVDLYERARDADERFWILQGRLRLLERLNTPEPSITNDLDAPATRSALLALSRIEGGSDNPFGEQKIATTQFYAEQILPRAAGHAGAVATASGSLQSFPLDWIAGA